MSRPGDGLDALRSMAALAVVCLHAAAFVLGDTRQSAGAAWWAANLLDSAMRWCVPVFVMISGALLLGREEPPGAFLRRRLLRLLPLLLVWSTAYLGLRALTEPGWRAADALPALLRGTPYYHLWYLFMLPGLCLFMPLLQRLLRAASPRRQNLVMLAALVCMLAAWLLPPAPSAFLRAPAFLAACVGGFLLHQAAASGSWPARIPAVLLWVVYLASSVSIAFAACALPAVFGQSGQALAYDYANPLVLLQAGAIFLLGLRMPVGVLLRLAPLSLGVYLLHPAVLLWLHQWPGLNGAAAMLPVALMTFAASAMLTMLLLALPGSGRWLR